MRSPKALELYRALAYHLKALEKTLEKHDKRREVWEDRGLGSWQDARLKLSYRIILVKEMLADVEAKDSGKS